jgi:hypothetical protein
VLVYARAQGLDGVALHVDDLAPAVDQRLGREAAGIAKRGQGLHLGAHGGFRGFRGDDGRTALGRGKQRIAGGF